jgi:hypothetical protein
MPGNTKERRRMKLKTLLKKIAFPIYPERNPQTDTPRRGSTGYSMHRNSEVMADGVRTPEWAEYLCHAANLLPELVAAAKNLHENWEKNLTAPMARLNEALALAENVFVEALLPRSTKKKNQPTSGLHRY